MKKKPKSHLFIKNINTNKLYIIKNFLNYFYIYIHIIYKLIQNKKNLIIKNTKLLFQKLPH